jgi:hypothetical protein
MKHLIAISVALAGLIGTALAQSPAPVEITEPWVRATVPAQKATGAFMQLRSAQGSRLVEVKSPVASAVEIHEMKMADGVMQMRAVPGVELPAGQTVELKPGGYHIMLLDLKQQMKDGETVPLTLVVEGKDKKRQSIEVRATVRPLTSQPAGHHH